MKNFVPFHVHPLSLDTASTPEAFAKKEVELGTGALTCTDHGSLAASYKTYELAKKNNLIPIVGIEYYFRSNDCPILTKLGIPKTNKVPKGIDKAEWLLKYPNGTFFEYNKYMHGTLHMRDFAAYKTAVKLLSKADIRAERHGSERKPLWDWQDIEELAAQNTTHASSCLVGMVSRHLLTEMEGVSKETKLLAATKYFEHLHYLFKDRFFVELFPHKCDHNYINGVFIDVEKNGVKETLQYYPGKLFKTNVGEIRAEELAKEFSSGKHEYLLGIANYRVWIEYEQPLKLLSVTRREGFYQNECSPWCNTGDMQYVANVFMKGMAKKYKVPIITSDDSHFADPKSYIVQCVRLSQNDGKDGGSWRFYEKYYRKNSLEAFEHFKQYHNTTEAEFESWVENSYQFRDGFKDFKFESNPQLATKFYPKDTLAYTKCLINKHGRMPKNNVVYLERLKKEIDLLHKNGKIDLLPYFFVDEEVCRLYQNQGYIASPGRGSGSGLLLNYLLGITHIDPIKNNLSLERFINKARIEANSLPDVDQDLSTRDLLVGYETSVIEVAASDGTIHTLPEGFMLETQEGVLPVEEAVSRQVEFEPWWNSSSSVQEGGG